MTTTYTKTISGDFTNASEVNISVLQQQITDNVTITTSVSHVNKSGDNIDIVFPSALSGAEQTELDSVVDAYTYTAIPPETKSNIYQTLVSNDVNYPGDYTSISAAFNAGATSVFVKNGIYVETQDIVIPNGGQLEGELPGKTVIVFIGAYSVKIDGSGGVKETAGTISITTNTSIVTGVGTTFTNLAVADFILLGTNYYEILTVDSDTQVTIKNTYIGNTISGDTYIAQSMYVGCAIQNLIITGSTITGLYLRGLRHSGLRTVAVTQCGSGIDVYDSSDLSIDTIIPTFVGGLGMNMVNSVSLSLKTVNVFNCVSHGFCIEDCSNVIIESCASENNNGSGFHLVNSSKYVNIHNTVIKNNNNIGVNYSSASTSNILNNCDISRNNGIGVQNQGNNNLVSTCFIHNNTGEGVVAGLKDKISCNSISNNSSDGIKIPIGEDYCSIVNNNIFDNGAIGINLLSTKSGLSNNNINNSVGDAIYVNGVKNKLSNNILSGNLSKGIHLDAGADNCIVTGNIVDTSTGNGLELITGATNNIITSNNLEGNTGTNYVDNGTGTVSASNITT